MKEKIKDIYLKFIEYFKKNYKELILLFLILVVGAFFRLYKIGDYMTFLGDEGRDAIIVRRFLVNFDIMLIGPGTSIGNMYLGPLYYYLIAPFLWIFKLSPVGPSVEVALFGVATILLVYLIGKEWFSKKAGFISAFLYAISPTVVIFSKSSWNPNIMPFFSLLMVYSIWKVWKKEKFNWLIVASICFAFVMQSHYFGGLLLPLIIIFWSLTFLALSTKSQEINDKSPISKFVRLSLVSIFIFAVLMSPLFIFDVRHNWMNFNSMKDFITGGDESLSSNPLQAIYKIPEVLDIVSARLLAGRVQNLGKVIVAVVSIPSIVLLLMRKRLHKNEASGFTVLTVWLLSGLFGLALFNYNLHDHYFGFLFPAPFLFFGGFIDGISENLSKLGKIVLFISLLFIFYVNIQSSPLRYQPNRQMKRSMDVAQKIEEESEGKAFNLAVLSKNNYEDGYGYFLEKDGLDPLHADIWDPPSISNQLFVVCEMPEKECDPTHSPKAEIVNFGWTDIEDQWEVDGVTIYKLVHSKKSKN